MRIAAVEHDEASPAGGGAPTHDGEAGGRGGLGLALAELDAAVRTGGTPSAAALVTLQRAFGNQFVQAALANRTGAAGNDDEVRAALLRHNALVIARDPAAFQAKLDKMAADPFAFFRGGVGLFYDRLRAGEQGAPTLLINGDVHPLNFDVAAVGAGQGRLALNDHDEAGQGPFTFDVKRGAAGFEIMYRQALGGAAAAAGASASPAARAFVEAYLAAVRAPGGPDAANVPLDEAKAQAKLAKKFLESDTRLKRSAELLEVADGDAAALRAAVVAGAPGWGALGPVEVLDLVERVGAGTGSIGMRRYCALVRGGTGTCVLELKEQKATPVEDGGPARDEAERVVGAVRRYAGPRTLTGAVTVALADRATGTPTPMALTVRQRVGGVVKAEDMTPTQLVTFGGECGAALARGHLEANPGAAATIAAYVDGRPDFVAECVAFATQAADANLADHASLKALRADGKL